MTGVSSGEFGFTWGETEDIAWLRNDDGDYKRIERPFLETLRGLATGERSVENLSADEREAVDLLDEEGYLSAGGGVECVSALDPIALWPRVLAFGVAFALLTAYVGYRLFASATTVPTAATVDLDVLEQLLITVPAFVGLALVHEAGHYLVARPYFDATLSVSRLNGVFPALVTETNDAWRCPRSVRVWINLAGPFADCCQCLALAALSLFVFPGSYALAVLPVFEYVRILFSLNPLVRGDGYWMVVDWFGVPNLYTRGVAALKGRRLTPGAAYVVASGLFTALTIGLIGLSVANLTGLA